MRWELGQHREHSSEHPPAWDGPSLPSSPASPLLTPQLPWAGGQRAAGDLCHLLSLHTSPCMLLQSVDIPDTEKNDSLIPDADKCPPAGPVLISVLITYATGWLNSEQSLQILSSVNVYLIPLLVGLFNQPLGAGLDLQQRRADILDEHYVAQFPSPEHHNKAGSPPAVIVSSRRNATACAL